MIGRCDSDAGEIYAEHACYMLCGEEGIKRRLASGSLFNQG
jgi:hypothetical protein